MGPMLPELLIICNHMQCRARFSICDDVANRQPRTKRYFRRKRTVNAPSGSMPRVHP